MTKVRTRIVKKNYAKTQNKQSYLVLDSDGLINVIDFDDMDRFLDFLSIVSNGISSEDFFNANLVLSFAEKLGLTPGIFIEGDVAILNYISRSISDDIEPEDRERVIQELKDSWLRVFKHPLVQRYIPLGEHRCLDNDGLSPHFPAIGALSFFMMNYYSGLVKLFLQSPEAPLELFMQLSELFYSASKGLAFIPNCFYQTEHLIELLKLTENQFVENKDIHAFLTKVQKDYEEETKLWLRRLLGWVIVELEDVNVIYVDDCAVGLRNLLARVSPVCENVELAQQLDELWKYLQGPPELQLALMSSVRFPSSAIPSSELSYLCTHAIEYSIRYYANLHGIKLYPRAPLIDAPMFYLAGGSDEEEMRLLAFLEERENCNQLKPFEFYAMARKCKRLELKERVSYEISLKVMDERCSQLSPMLAALSLYPCALARSSVLERSSVLGRHMLGGSVAAITLMPPRPVFTPRWAKLQDSIRGKVDEPTPVASSSSSVEPPMEAVLNLREERGCIIC